MIPKKVVYVAMSGGVDSSVAAALLQQQGFDVRGVFMRYWGDVDDLMPGGEDFTNCCNIEAMNDAQRVCDHLGVPLSVMDLRGKFREDVVRSFLNGYQQGITPNPCVECNRSIKFELIERILNDAAPAERDNIFFATGHYIRLVKGQELRDKSIDMDRSLDPRPSTLVQQRLFVAKDTRKDQSYFLYTLTQEKLRRLLFPLGDYTKPEVRELARSFGLPVANKAESQEVCFVKGHVNEFLASRITKPTPGTIVATNGERLGEHKGLPFYTIGQREGLNLGSGGPYFVVEKQMTTNTLVVARGERDSALYTLAANLKNVNWVSGQRPDGPRRVIAKPRYRHAGAPALVTSQEQRAEGGDRKHVLSPYLSAFVRFDSPERSLTQGQSVVFYQQSGEGLEVLGGGIIEN